MAVKPLQSLARALGAIDAIAEHQPVGLSALARALDEDKSALQRVLVTLHAAGWIPTPNIRMPMFPARADERKAIDAVLKNYLD